MSKNSGDEISVKSNNNFGITRLIAAHMVIGGHMAVLINGTVPLVLGSAIHSWGIKIFFIIGGYLVTKSWTSDPHPLRYTIKRAFRIFPPLIIYVLFATFIAGAFLTTLPLSQYYSNLGTYSYLRNIFLYVQYVLPGVFTNNPYPYAVNGSLWSLPVEVLMYVLIPLIFAFLGLIKHKKASQIGLVFFCGLFFILRLAQIRFFPNWSFVVYSIDVGQALGLVPYYMIGSLFTLQKMQKLLNLPLAMLLILFYCCFQFSYFKSEFMLMILVPYLVFSLALSEKVIFPKLFSKIEVSYGLYLYGFFVQQTLVAVFSTMGINLSQTIYVIISMIITWAFALLSMRFIEKPMLKISKKILNRQLLK